MEQEIQRPTVPLGPRGTPVKRFLLLLALVSAVPAFAQNKTLVNVDKGGLGLQGYDPVAFFSDGRPVKGQSQLASTYNGARYLFASAENKAAFDANPAKYEPQFGGFCAYAASEGHTAPVKVDAFMIVNGRLLMQYDQDVKKIFEKDPQGRLAKADKNWPSLVQKYGR